MADLDEDKATSHAPKKRAGKRVSVACDECRLRKAKCDGLLPCETCSTSQRYCSYNLSAARSSGPGMRIRILEDRLRRARAYLAEAQKRTPSLAHIDFDALLNSGPPLELDPAEQTQDPNSETRPDFDDSTEDLDSMMNAYGQLTIDANESRDFYGPASSLAFITKATDFWNSASSSQSSSDDNSDPNLSAAVQLFDARLPPKHDFDSVDAASLVEFPSRETASNLANVVFSQVYPMFHFLEEEEFRISTDRLYETEPQYRQSSQQGFCALFHLVVGLGFLFCRQQHENLGCKASITRGMRHFLAARSVLDIANLRNIVSLQSLVCLILFLVSTARLGSAHAYLGLACATTTRQGLHFRATHELQLSVHERRARRKVFWAVVNLDMYINAILGLPRFLDLTAVDPALDLTINDALKEWKSGAGLSTIEGLSIATSAKHIELMRIVFRAQRTLYPMPTDPPGATTLNGTIIVSVKKMKEVERQYRDWAMSLSDILAYEANDYAVEALCLKYEIHIAYAFANILLYRSFLHYLARENDSDGKSHRQLSYAHTCVQMASNVIEISVHHQRRGLLCPSSWPAVYTVFMSTSCLIFAYATRKEQDSQNNIRADIEEGIKLLACTACTTDTGSVRCLELLRRLIKRVSYSVDIDLDQIVNNTTPCCLNDIALDPESSMDVRSKHLRIPLRRTSHISTATLGVTSETSSRSNTSHQGQLWTLSPSDAATQTSSASLSHGTDPSHSANGRSNQTSSEDLMDVSYFPSAFGWPPYQGLEIGNAASSSAKTDPIGGRSSADTSTSQARLTAEEISRFIHNSGSQDPFSSQPQTDR